MTEIHLRAPVVEEDTIRFSWTMDPEPSLYQKNEFFLRFPAEVTLSNVPQPLKVLLDPELREKLRAGSTKAFESSFTAGRPTSALRDLYATFGFDGAKPV